MEDLQKEYGELAVRREAIINELNLLRECTEVKRYLELTKENDSLYYQQIQLYFAMKEKDYESCKHILVYSKIDHDRFEGRTYKKCGCIKCGLDNSILDYDEKFLSLSGKAMYSYLRKKYLTGIETKIACDLDLAKAIYVKIKEAHPNIDDKTTIQYLENALDHIREIPVNKEREESRAKRLSLSYDFKRWNSRDVSVN